MGDYPPLYKVVMQLYPWVSETDARKIAHEAEKKRNDHMFEAAKNLKSKNMTASPLSRPQSNTTEDK